MKREASRKRTYLFIGLAFLLILLLAIGLFYTRSVYVSSCAVLSAWAVGEAIPFEGNVSSGFIPCPAPEQEAILPGHSESSSPGSSGKSSKSKSDVMNSPETNTTNSSEVNLSPAEQNTQMDLSNVSSKLSLSRALIDEYIATNGLDVNCAVYNKTIEGSSSLVILDGHSTVYFFGFEIKVPIKSSLVVSQNKIILECIKRPWWAYLFR